MRNDSPSVTTTTLWWSSRSSRLTAVVCSGRKRPHSSKGQCERDARAQRVLISSGDDSEEQLGAGVVHRREADLVDQDEVGASGSARSPGRPSCRPAPIERLDELRGGEVADPLEPASTASWPRATSRWRLARPSRARRDRGSLSARSTRGSPGSRTWRASPTSAATSNSSRSFVDREGGRVSSVPSHSTRHVRRSRPRRGCGGTPRAPALGLGRARGAPERVGASPRGAVGEARLEVGRELRRGGRSRAVTDRVVDSERASDDWERHDQRVAGAARLRHALTCLEDGPHVVGPEAPERESPARARR